MNVSIAPEFENFVNSKIEDGVYASVSELVGDALRLLAERDELRRMRIEKLNHEIQLGLDDVASGKVITAEESKKRMVIFKQQFLNNPGDKTF